MNINITIHIYYTLIYYEVLFYKEIRDWPEDAPQGKTSNRIYKIKKNYKLL